MRQAVRHEKTEFDYYYSVNKARQGRGKYQRDTTDDTLRHDKSLKHVFLFLCIISLTLMLCLE